MNHCSTSQFSHLIIYPRYSSKEYNTALDFETNKKRFSQADRSLEQRKTATRIRVCKYLAKASFKHTHTLCTTRYRIQFDLQLQSFPFSFEAHKGCINPIFFFRDYNFIYFYILSCGNLYKRCVSLNGTAACFLVFSDIIGN